MVLPTALNQREWEKFVEDGSGNVAVRVLIEGTIDEGQLIIDVDNTEALLVRKDGDAGDVFIVDTNDSNGLVGIRKTPAVTLDILHPGTAAGGIQLQTSVNDATAKGGRIKVAHYTNSEEPISMLVGTSASTTSTLAIGGGSSLENAMTDIDFYVAANNTTITGNAILQLSNSNITSTRKRISTYTSTDTASTDSMYDVDLTITNSGANANGYRAMDINLSHTDANALTSAGEGVVTLNAAFTSSGTGDITLGRGVNISLATSVANTITQFDMINMATSITNATVTNLYGINLLEHSVSNPTNTYFIRLNGNDWTDGESIKVEDSNTDKVIPLKSAASLTLGAAATTFAVTGSLMTITGDAGANTIATITGGYSGQILTLLFVDGNVTVTDDNSHASDSVDLSAAFTSADDTILQLVYDGTSWYEVSRSVN